MLLLYRLLLLTVNGLISYLHSIMLLLYRKGGKAVIKKIRENLHSIMLLLYPRAQWQIDAHGYIYIPLCFYFIVI